VQQVDFGKTDPAQEVQLKGDRARRVLAVDVIEDFPTVARSAEGFEVAPVALPHQVLHAGNRVGNEIGDPGAAAGGREVEDFPERGFPVALVPQVMQHRRRNDHVVAARRQVDRAEIPLPDRGSAFLDRADPFTVALDHGPVQVYQVAVKRVYKLQELEGVVARAASNVQDMADRLRHRQRGAGDELHRQRRVHRGLLASLKVRKALHVVIEAPADVLDGGFAGKRSFHVRPNGRLYNAGRSRVAAAWKQVMVRGAILMLRRNPPSPPLPKGAKGDFGIDFIGSGLKISNDARGQGGCQTGS
jgi:hypothetical protein